MKSKNYQIIIIIIISLTVVGIVIYSQKTKIEDSIMLNDISGIYSNEYDAGFNDSIVLILYNDNRYITIIKSDFTSFPEKGEWEKTTNYLKLIPYTENLASMEFEIKKDALIVQNDRNQSDFVLKKLKFIH
ncbi:MAG: hypothetical protein U9N34_07415 [Candidatus Cloacimonadota bacterium]|nr:hypothetical protein [Candidatus Cloacimonadota bacterium]